MKKLLLSFIYFIFLAAGLNVFAVPAQSEWVLFTQPDGTTVTILLSGDENLNYVHDKDGYTLLMKDGFYYYATLNANGDMVVSDIVARDNSNKSVGISRLSEIEKGLTYSQNQLAQRKIKHLGNGAVNSSMLKSSGIQSSTFPSKGKRKLLMILVNFSDTEPTYTREDFDRYMNEENYNGIGSFRDFYLENSYGQLDITTTVTRWVTLSKRHAYYGEGDDRYAYQAVIEAIDQLDDEIDFSEFDNDGDGIVDGLAIIHQGQGEEFSGSNTDNIWSHSWSLSSALYPKNPPKKDGVYIDSYTIQPEIRAGNNSTRISTIGVMCHEFGHNLGAPDYYDTKGNNNGTGQWDLMAAGSWNGTSGDRPAHFTAYQKSEFGWLDLKELPVSADISLKPASKYADAYILHTVTNDEFFVLENRQKSGAFETALPGSDMIIYHVDENHIRQKYYSNQVNVGSHQGIYPIVASGNMNNPNTARCPFPGAGNKISFTDETTPSSLSWSGRATNRPITDIRKVGENIHFTISEPDDLSVTPINPSVKYLGLTRVKLSWEAGEDAIYDKYNVYRDGTLIADGVTGFEFTDNNASSGVNNYTIHNRSSGGSTESDGLEVSVLCDVTENYIASNASIAIDGTKISIKWDNPVVMADGFEDMTPFSINPSNNIGWSYADVDEQPTLYFSGRYTNKVEAKSFICFNPSRINGGSSNELVNAIEGNQYMVSFASSNEFVPTDDWMISPKLDLKVAHKLMFYARSQKLEDNMNVVNELNVAVSSTENNISDFAFVNGSNTIKLDNKWTRYEVAIPAGTKYFALNNASQDGFAVMIDDLSLRLVAQNESVNSAVADFYPPSTITGFDVYRDNVLIKSDVKTTMIEDVIQMRGSYVYRIESLVGKDKTPFAALNTTVLVRETAVNQVATPSKEVVLYPNPANDRFNVRCDGHTIESVEVYSVAGNVVLRSGNSSEISISKLPAGYYVVKVKTNYGMFVKRLQKR